MARGVKVLNFPCFMLVSSIELFSLHLSIFHGPAIPCGRRQAPRGVRYNSHPETWCESSLSGCWRREERGGGGGEGRRGSRRRREKEKQCCGCVVPVNVLIFFLVFHFHHQSYSLSLSFSLSCFLGFFLFIPSDSHAHFSVNSGIVSFITLL